MNKYAILYRAFAINAVAASAAFAHSDAEIQAKIERLEQRLARIEARLSRTGQEAGEVKALPAATGITRGDSSFNVLASSAWRNLRWTQEEQWEGIEKGVTRETVVEKLGYPPRSIKSLKPRVDLVYYYETSLRDSVSSIRGKVSFKDGAVIAVSKPDFSKFSIAP